MRSQRVFLLVKPLIDQKNTVDISVSLLEMFF